MPMWNEKHLRAATRAAGIALWSWNVDTDAITMDEHAYNLWEVSKDEQKITFEILSKNIHPADLERVRSAFAATRAVIGAYEIDFRILSGNDIRWISARGQGDDADIADRLMFGVFLDVTQARRKTESVQNMPLAMNCTCGLEGALQELAFVGPGTALLRPHLNWMRTDATVRKFRESVPKINVENTKHRVPHWPW